MTGHTPSSQQSQEFLSTMHTMIDDLDTISSHIDEHTYLRLVNGLQRLYNIHNTGTQANMSNNIDTRIHEQPQIFNEENNIAQNISSALIRHYERVNDISGIPINAYPVNTYVYHVNSDNANNQNNHSMHWIEAALREGITRA
jgi:hypothetical protein|uniref:Uncharacterized protein n=1 Tax=viral metagenome TaxID=1070528 RepID=A0A6C0CDJ8_9ZZZZ